MEEQGRTELAERLRRMVKGDRSLEALASDYEVTNNISTCIVRKLAALSPASSPSPVVGNGP
jgi:hypothetical protein